MGDWIRHRVSDLEARGLLRVEDGNHGEDRPRRDEFVSSGTMFIRAADLAGGLIDFSGAEQINDVALARIRKGVGAPGDVLLSHKGTVGRVAFTPLDAPPFVCSPQTTFWRSLDVDRIDRRYLRFFLESPDFVEQLRSRKGETDMADYVSLTEQRRLEVVLPPIEEQRAIAAVLGALDDKIEVNRRLSGTADELLRVELSSAYDDDWPEVPVSSLAQFVNGGAYTNGATGHGRMVIRIAELKNGPGRSTVYNELDVPDEKLARPGDVLMSWSGSLGVFRWVRPASIINQHIFKVICHAYPTWLVYVKLAEVIPEFQQIAADKATTMGHIKRHHLDDAKVRVPPVGMLRELDDALGPLWRRVVAAEVETLTLEALRDALLPELLSGRFRVRDAEEAAEAVT